MCSVNRTPLYLASMRGHFDVYRELLDAGAKVSLPSNRGHTPFQMALENSNWDTCQLLLDAGAECKMPTNDVAILCPLHVGEDNVWI